VLTKLETAEADSLEGARETAHRLAEREERNRAREVAFEK
jgi:hypothetical protein